MKTQTVDMDGHIMEPADLWEKNLEPRFRDRALRIRCDENGAEYFEVAGKKSDLVQGGNLGFFGTLDQEMKARVSTASLSAGGPEYEAYVPMEARDMQRRLKWMDTQQIDHSVLFPSLCLGWQNECDDADLAAAYCRVYNDWLTDLCAPVSDRLLPMAMVPLLNIDDGVRELNRAADAGARGLYLTPVPMNGVPYGDTTYDPLWAACEERNLPIALHVSNTPLHSGRQFYETTFQKNFWFMMMMYTPDCQIAFTSFFNGGVFERFPTLSVGVVEIGCGWIAHWLSTMDHSFELGGHELMKQRPSEYFERQCWVSGETDERAFPAMANLVGAHKLVWGSDYPHEEGRQVYPIKTLKETLAALDPDQQNMILGDNAMKIMNLRPAQ